MIRYIDPSSRVSYMQYVRGTAVYTTCNTAVVRIWVPEARLRCAFPPPHSRTAVRSYDTLRTIEEQAYQMVLLCPRCYRHLVLLYEVYTAVDYLYSSYVTYHTRYRRTPFKAWSNGVPVQQLWYWWVLRTFYSVYIIHPFAFLPPSYSVCIIRVARHTPLYRSNSYFVQH